MSDLISRQAAIAEFSCCQLTPDGGIDANYAIDFLKQLPPAQPEQLSTNLAEVGTDCISRQAAIDFVDAGHLVNPNEPRWSDNEVVNFLKSRPSAQPDIVRCKDCKYSDENLRRVSVKWLPCMEDIYLYLSGNWYCGSAERREK